MKSNEVRIFDSVSRRYINALQVVLLSIADETHLPELYEIFGQEKLLKFLDVFSGTTVKVPDRAILHDALRNTNIYLRLHKLPEGDRAEAIKELALEFDITTRTVRTIFYATQETMSRFRVE